jgi:hypothetical protein
MSWNVGWGPSGRLLLVWRPTVLTLAAAFILDFPAAGLGAAVDLGSGFLVVVTLDCLDASVTNCGEGNGFFGGDVEALKALTLGRRDSTLGPGPPDRHKGRPSEFWER